MTHNFKSHKSKIEIFILCKALELLLWYIKMRRNNFEVKGTVCFMNVPNNPYKVLCKDYILLECED